MGLTNLPAELHLELAGYLSSDPIDLLNLSKASRTLCHIYYPQFARTVFDFALEIDSRWTYRVCQAPFSKLDQLLESWEWEKETVSIYDIIALFKDYFRYLEKPYARVTEETKTESKISFNRALINFVVGMSNQDERELAEDGVVTELNDLWRELCEEMNEDGHAMARILIQRCCFNPLQHDRVRKSENGFTAPFTFIETVVFNVYAVFEDLLRDFGINTRRLTGPDDREFVYLAVLRLLTQAARSAGNYPEIEPTNVDKEVKGMVKLLEQLVFRAGGISYHLSDEVAEKYYDGELWTIPLVAVHLPDILNSAFLDYQIGIDIEFDPLWELDAALLGVMELVCQRLRITGAAVDMQQILARLKEAAVDVERFAPTMNPDSQWQGDTVGSTLVWLAKVFLQRSIDDQERIRTVVMEMIQRELDSRKPIPRE